MTHGNDCDDECGSADVCRRVVDDESWSLDATNGVWSDEFSCADGCVAAADCKVGTGAGDWIAGLVCTSVGGFELGERSSCSIGWVDISVTDAGQCTYAASFARYVASAAAVLELADARSTVTGCVWLARSHGGVSDAFERETVVCRLPSVEACATMVEQEQTTDASIVQHPERSAQPMRLLSVRRPTSAPTAGLAWCVALDGMIFGTCLKARIITPPLSSERPTTINIVLPSSLSRIPPPPSHPPPHPVATPLHPHLTSPNTDLLERCTAHCKQLTTMRLSKTSRDVLAGTSGGVAQVMVGQPFDIVKVRLQTAQHGTYTGIADCAARIIKSQGPLGFYSGTLTPLLGVGACVSIQFGVVGAVKRHFARRNGSSADALNNTQLYLAGGAAGVANSIVACP